MIVTSENENNKGDKEKLLKEQLYELKLGEHTEVIRIPPKKDETKQIILFSIKFPADILNHEAECIGIESTLQFN
jgi:hypothetical protein